MGKHTSEQDTRNARRLANAVLHGDSATAEATARHISATASPAARNRALAALVAAARQSLGVSDLADAAQSNKK